MAFEYGGDENGEDLKEIEVEEKMHLLGSAVSATLARSCACSCAC